MEKNRLGLVHVYTGEGKGKTTAAIGMAVRAAGHGLKTYIAAFLKPAHSGEFFALKQLGNHLIFDRFSDETENRKKEKASELARRIANTDFKGWIMRDKVTVEEKKKAASLLKRARAAMLSGEFQVVVLDEIIVALGFGLISFEQVKQFIEDRPSEVELILTGRGGTPELIELADVVTEMKEIKHPYRRGIKAREGIDF